MKYENSKILLKALLQSRPQAITSCQQVSFQSSTIALQEKIITATNDPLNSIFKKQPYNFFKIINLVTE